MVYKNVEDKIAVSIRSLRLPVGKEKIKDILGSMGLVEIHPDLSSLAKNLVGKSTYQRGARPEQAPDVVDCSSLVKWIYGQAGIWLPRHSIDQPHYGRKVKAVKAGDLIFTSGAHDYFWTDPSDGVGHVGMAISHSAVVHATNSRAGIMESTMADFYGKPERQRGIRRYLFEKDDMLILQMPDRRVETSQELRWRILQHI